MNECVLRWLQRLGQGTRRQEDGQLSPGKGELWRTSEPQGQEDRALF